MTAGTGREASGRGIVTLALPVDGMCCVDEAGQVEAAVGRVAGIQVVQALVAAERAIVTYDPAVATPEAIRAAVRDAGFRLKDEAVPDEAAGRRRLIPAGEALGTGILVLAAAVIVLSLVGEALGWFDQVLELVPWWVPAGIIALGGWPIFLGVWWAALQRRVTGHTLMTVGMIAAIAIGEWATALLLVFFMRFSSWIEEAAMRRSRAAIRDLVALQPPTARLLRDGQELEVPVSAVVPGDLVVVRPGERIPVDGEVQDGAAPVDQAAITGESIPVEKAPGAAVYAATMVQGGSLVVRATRTGDDTTFAQIIRLVEEAEVQKSPVQRFADRFSAYYLPVVMVIALVTFLVSGQVLNAVAVLVVACSCAIVMATPLVVLASVGNGARRGLLVKGGLVLEQLARVDTLVIDKTGTVTSGVPRVTRVVAGEGWSDEALLGVVAAVEARSEHPLARALVREALEREIAFEPAGAFVALPGLGVTGNDRGRAVAVGNRRLLAEAGVTGNPALEEAAAALEAAGQTVFFVAVGGTVAGAVAVADPVRPDVAAALATLRQLGIRQVLMLTGDSARVAGPMAAALGVEYRAELLPEGKIAVVRELQAAGRVVMMVGDGVNDAPALAQADVGVAMGVMGTDVAVDAADVVLMWDDWATVPALVRLGRRASRTIRQNLLFTAVYNIVGIGLAATGILPPVWAAAAQTLPDVGVMLNSARLLRTPAGERTAPAPAPAAEPATTG